MIVEHLLCRNRLYENNDDLVLIGNICGDVNDATHHDQQKLLRHNLKCIMITIMQRKIIKEQKQQRH